MPDILTPLSQIGIADQAPWLGKVKYEATHPALLTNTQTGTGYKRGRLYRSGRNHSFSCTLGQAWWQFASQVVDVNSFLKRHTQKLLCQVQLIVLHLSKCKSASAQDFGWKYKAYLSHISVNPTSWSLWFHNSKSQNHKMVEVGRDSWKSSDPTPLLKQGHLKQLAEDHIQMSLSYFHRLTVTELLRLGRDLWRSSSPMPLLNQGHLEHVTQDLVHAGF